MTPEHTTPAFGAERLPTIALLGEFSAGKSTLANVLLGVQHSPVRVTATQAPPIWYVPGTGHAVRIASDGTESELQDGSLDDIALKETLAVRVPLSASILQKISMIDMPGSSDPNMSPDIWDALLPQTDIAIWCTPATQAWRQSEAAIWDTVPEDLRQRSLLLVTRMDKVTGPADRSRIVKRIERETEGLFHAVLPVALLKATHPPSQCKASGMSQVMRELAGVLAPAPTDPGKPDQPPSPTTLVKATERPKIVPRRVAADGRSPNSRIIRRPRMQDPAP